MAFAAIMLSVFSVGVAHAETVSGVTYPFSLTTTSLNADDTFQFTISAAGTFYVDCGVDGTLSGTGVSGNTITKSDTTEYTYTCTYSSGTAKTIQFGGTATAYHSSTAVSAISFYISSSNISKIASISGNLSAIFPYLGSGTNQIPRFFRTFYLLGLRSIPDTLFSSYTGDLSGATHMFDHTFAWSKLTQIPENLFSGITVGAPYMFYATFWGCNSLTSIPENLFTNITNSAEGMFEYTFAVCTSLTSLPERLFANFTTPATNLFRGTFIDCRNLRGYIPKTLFAGLIANGSPTATDMMTGIFGATPTYNYGTPQLATSCPSGTGQYITGYESYWDGHVSCKPNTLSLTFDGTTTLSCDYGGTFTVPPPPAPRKGYVFTGWVVNPQPSGE